MTRSLHTSLSQAAAKLAVKNAQAYYSNVTCTKACFEVCSKLNSIRASSFGGCTSTKKRGKRGKKMSDADMAKNLRAEDDVDSKPHFEAASTPPTQVVSAVVSPDDPSLLSFLNTPRSDEGVVGCGLPQTPLFLKRMVMNKPDDLSDESSSGERQRPAK